MAAAAAAPVAVDFEDAGFDSAETSRHDLLLSALDHLLSKTFDAIDALHVCRAANVDAIDAALGSAVTGLDMLYISREATPISGTSIAHASWWEEKAPEPCDSETWLRAAIPEAPRSHSSFVMDQFLKAQGQGSRPAPSRSMSRASSAHSHVGAGAGAGAGALVSPSSRPGSVSQQQRNGPQGGQLPMVAATGRRQVKGPPSPDAVKSAENGLREELEIRRAHAAVARELEAKDAAEKEQLVQLQKQLKGRDYSYDHKGKVVVLNGSDLAAVPDNAPAFRLASPELPLSPGRPGFSSSVSKKQLVQPKGQGKERRGAADYQESRSTSQPNALETLQPTLGVTLRQGNQSKSGPPQQRGSQGTNMTREEFERFMANKTQQRATADAGGYPSGSPGRRTPATAPAPGPGPTERSAAGLRAAGPTPQAAKASAPNTPQKSAADSSLNKTNSRSSGSSLLAALPDAAPMYAGAVGTSSAAGGGSQGRGRGTPQAPPAPHRLMSTPDINPSLTSAPDWGAPGNAPGYDVPPSLPVVKPSSKLRELEVGRSDMLPRERTNLATISPPRTKPPAPRGGASAR